MGIYIKGMEMPETCDMCPFLVFISKGDDHDAFCYCKLINWKKSCTPDPITVFQARRFRDLNCPLVELEPHGDLIDRKVLLENIVKRLGIKSRKYFTQQESFLCSLIDETPAVIQAEENE